MKLHLIISLLCMAGVLNVGANPIQPVKYVNPFVGTGGHGHTYPGATVPFGMVQLSPDNGTQGWDWCSGYHYSDSMIVGFSHTHLSGTGIGDLLDISVMPMVGVKPDTTYLRSKFSHERERAFPGYYQVWLQDFGINAELTTTQRVGMHRYTFPAAKDASIKVDLGWAINWDRATDCHFKQISPTRFVGYRKSKGWANNQLLYFAIDLNKPVKNVSLFADKKAVGGNNATAKKVAAFLQFSTTKNEAVLMKVGLSTTSEAAAIASLSEVSGWNFDAVQQKATNLWNKELSAIEVQSSDTSFLRTFYSALYHTYLAPVVTSDADGNYRGADFKVHPSKGPVYTIHSLWDTFRAANPLFTIIQNHRVANIIQSYLNFYKQTGLLPVWDLYFNETNTMTGYHAVPVIADAILKGIEGFDYQVAFEAMKASAMQNIRGTNYYRQYGYVPHDLHGWSVTITLEYAYDDWCIAQVAKKLGRQADYETFMARSQNFRNLFDPQSGFFRAKNSDGKFVEPFDPYHSEHGEQGMYIEGTAWQHTFFVPHAWKDYANLLGGIHRLDEKLDSLFTTSSEIRGSFISNDITGLIGQYAHGNEPSHHIAYLFTAMGKPAKTADRVHQIMTTMYSDKEDGLSGNEDCGQMSAWYVWSALGMYPMNASSGEYVIGTPSMDAASIRLPDGKKFNIKVTRQSPQSIYVSTLTLNNQPIAIQSIRHEDLLKGGELHFTLSDKP